MTKRKGIALVLCVMLTICAMLPTAAKAGKNAFAGFFDKISGIFSDDVQQVPGYPVFFSWEDRELFLPGKFSAFLMPGWMIHNAITDEYMSKYELVDGFCTRELVLRKDNQEILINIRNNKPYELEMKECDVERIAVEAFSYVNNSVPDFEVYGIRPGGSIHKLPKWLRQSSIVKSGDMECESYFYEEDQEVFAMIEGSGGSVHVYCMFDDEGVIEYVSLEVFP